MKKNYWDKFDLMAMTIAILIFISSALGISLNTEEIESDPTENQQNMGYVLEISKSVKRRPSGHHTWDSLIQGFYVHDKDVIFVSPGSQLTLELEGKTKLELSENTLIVLEKTKNKKNNNELTEVRLIRGDLAVDQSKSEKTLTLKLSNRSSVQLNKTKLAVRKQKNKANLVIAKGKVETLKNPIGLQEDLEIETTHTENEISLQNLDQELPEREVASLDDTGSLQSLLEEIQAPLPMEEAPEEVVVQTPPPESLPLPKVSPPPASPQLPQWVWIDWRKTMPKLRINSPFSDLEDASIHLVRMSANGETLLNADMTDLVEQAKERSSKEVELTFNPLYLLYQERFQKAIHKNTPIHWELVALNKNLETLDKNDRFLPLRFQVSPTAELNISVPPIIDFTSNKLKISWKLKKRIPAKYKVSFYDKDQLFCEKEIVRFDSQVNTNLYQFLKKSSLLEEVKLSFNDSLTMSLSDECQLKPNLLKNKIQYQITVFDINNKKIQLSKSSHAVGILENRLQTKL